LPANVFDEPSLQRYGSVNNLLINYTWRIRRGQLFSSVLTPV